MALNAHAETFRYAFRVDPASLDPQAIAETFTLSWLGQIYEPLVGRGKNLELTPALATKWEQPDPLTWRFTFAPTSNSTAASHLPRTTSSSPSRA